MRNKRDERLGMSLVMKNGLRATITGYRAFNDIDVTFENGYVAEHKNYQSFLNGVIGHPDINTRTYIAKGKHVGETLVMNNGMEATITAYNNAADITVTFKDGTVVKTRLSNFTSGRVPNGNYGEARLVKKRKERLGAVRVMHCGEAAQVIRYGRASDMDIRFLESKRVAEHVQWWRFEAGLIAPP